MDANPLPRRQQECLDFVRGHLAAHGEAPKYTEIAAAMGLANKSKAHDLVSALVALSRKAGCFLPPHGGPLVAHFLRARGAFRKKRHSSRLPLCLRTLLDSAREKLPHPLFLEE